MTSPPDREEINRLRRLLDLGNGPLMTRIAQLETDLQVARTNAKHWHSRFLLAQNSAPTAISLVFELPPEILTALHREATVRGSTTNALARRLVETVVKDRLFNAVLDQ